MNEPQRKRATVHSLINAEGVSPGAQSEGDARKPSDGSVSAKKPGTVIRAKAESNPVASKLGLGTSAPCDSMAAVVPGAVSGLPPRQVEHEHARGRGPGRGRGGRVIVPGRGGRPLYKPLIPVIRSRVRGTCSMCFRRSPVIVATFSAYDFP